MTQGPQQQKACSLEIPFFHVKPTNAAENRVFAHHCGSRRNARTEKMLRFHKTIIGNRATNTATPI
jgi:hypothetical protein